MLVFAQVDVSLIEMDQEMRAVFQVVNVWRDYLND